jgi:hypothetical protein
VRTGKARKVSNTKHGNEYKDILWGRKVLFCGEEKYMTVCHRGRQERRSIPAKKEMRKCS